MAKLAARELNAISEEIHDKLSAEKIRLNKLRDEGFLSSEFYTALKEKTEKFLDEIGFEEDDYARTGIRNYVRSFAREYYNSNHYEPLKSVPTSNDIRRRIIISEIDNPSINIEELFQTLKQELFNT